MCAKLNPQTVKAQALHAFVAEWHDANRPKWEPLPHQQIPDGDWYGYLGLMGRGCGKTDACAKFVADHVAGPRCAPYGPEPHRIAIVAPTKGDAESCWSNVSGIRAHAPRTELIAGAMGGATIRWPNGSTAQLFGANTVEDVDRLRAKSNRCLVWYEELAAMRYMVEAFDQAMLGLRLGPHPRWIGSTTPRPKELIKQFAKGFVYRGRWEVPFAGATVIVQHAITDDNPYLPPQIRASLVARHAGTALGEQELMGRVVDDDPSALWKRDQIARFRLTPEEAPLEIMRRIIVGVDPSGGVDEQGIVVVGFSDAPLFHPEHTTQIERGFVLADYSCKLPPDRWGDRAIQAAIDFEATGMCYESNYGREMPGSVLNNAAERAGMTIPIRPALATVNKKGRAYPVAQKATQGRYPHVGVFEELEDQLCMWTEDAKESPDRMDAMVWPAWHTGFVSTRFKGQGSMSGGQMARRSISDRS